MKKSSRRRPQVESLESLMLLSTLVTEVQPVARMVSHPLQSPPISQVGRVQAIGHASLSGPTAPVGTTSHRVVTGVASSSTIANQAGRRLVVMADGSGSTIAIPSPRPRAVMEFGSNSTTINRGRTVHAMVMPGGKPVVIGHFSSPVASAAPQGRAGHLIAVGHSSGGLKLS